MIGGTPLGVYLGRPVPGDTCTGYICGATRHPGVVWELGWTLHRLWDSRKSHVHMCVCVEPDAAPGNADSPCCCVIGRYGCAQLRTRATLQYNTSLVLVNLSNIVTSHVLPYHLTITSSESHVSTTTHQYCYSLQFVAVNLVVIVYQFALENTANRNITSLYLCAQCPREKKLY